MSDCYPKFNSNPNFVRILRWYFNDTPTDGFQQKRESKLKTFLGTSIESFTCFSPSEQIITAQHGKQNEKFFDFSPSITDLGKT